MADSIKCTISVEVGGAIKVTARRTLTVESYSKIDVALTDTDPVAVTLPAAPTDLDFLLITANIYGENEDGSQQLQYRDAADTDHLLEGPLLLFGGDIGTAALGNPLTFTNTWPDPVYVQIIAGQADVTA